MEAMETSQDDTFKSNKFSSKLSLNSHKKVGLSSVFRSSKEKPIKIENSQDKFSGDGISFKGKLIGVDPVSGPRGDEMCKEAMQRLKTIIKGTGSHKQRIILRISFDGLTLKDEKTGEIIASHSIPLISYISRDINDHRAFGFVYGSPDMGHQFIGIKTEKPAIPIMSTIGELFRCVYEQKKKVNGGKFLEWDFFSRGCFFNFQGLLDNYKDDVNTYFRQNKH